MLKYKKLVISIAFIMLFFTYVYTQIKLIQVRETLQRKESIIWCMEHTKPVRIYKRKINE